MFGKGDDVCPGAVFDGKIKRSQSFRRARRAVVEVRLFAEAGMNDEQGFFFAVRKFRRQDIVAQFGNVRIQVGAYFCTAARGQ